jgi:TadE-like protein
MSQARRRRSRDRGAAAVEAALVLPLLLMIIFGIIDFGRMLNAQIRVTEAAREAARAVSLGQSPEPVTAALDITEPLSVSGCSGGAANATVEVTYEFEFVTPFALMADFAADSFDLTSTGVMPCRS